MNQLKGLWIQVPFAGCNPCKTEQLIFFTSVLVHMVQNLLASTRINLLHEDSPYICLSSVFPSVTSTLICSPSPVSSTSSAAWMSIFCIPQVSNGESWLASELALCPRFLGLSCCSVYMCLTVAGWCSEHTCIFPLLPNTLTLDRCIASNKAFKPFLRADMAVNNSFPLQLLSTDTAAFFHCSAYGAEVSFLHEKNVNKIFSAPHWTALPR